MKKTMAMTLLVSMAVTSLAHADEPAPTSSPQQPAPTLSPDDPGMISPLVKWQPAPFPGVLFSPRAAASVVTDVATMKDKIKIEVDAAVKVAEAKKDFTYNELDARCKSDRTKIGRAHV